MLLVFMEIKATDWFFVKDLDLGAVFTIYVA